tara:strand:- start:77021 stop:78154 length:1134 start_codon:yes stop_codon:yes gene_type:complete
MILELKHFKNNLPAFVIEFLDLACEHDFLPSIIGGIPRDYLLSNTIGSDFDICLRAKKNLDQIEAFTIFLKNKYPDLSEKAYHVLDLGNGIEVSFPRKEIFGNEIGHSNFEVELLQDLHFNEDVQRRDFTINAISFTYVLGNFELNDPLGGVSDLKNRILRAANYQNFVKDPVRFLRAIRFHILLDFEFETNTEELIKNMHLKLTAHYLKYEAKKTKRPLTFLLMIKYFRDDIIPIDFEAKDDDILEYENQVELKDLGEHIRFAFFLSKEIRMNVLGLFALKTVDVYNIKPWQIDLFELRDIELEHLNKLSFIKELIRFFEKATGINPAILNYFDFKKPISTLFYQQYNEVNISVPKNVEPKLRSLFVFREKLKEIL